ncbi:MAG: restriction endonuclease subunit M [Alphaproteobacteria bacterium]|nr:restriction endonuclease subunit M [Alphaproteobacteria bacterium]
MPFGIDILEDEIRSWGHDILESLLCDRTTGENIIWATDDYKSHGDGFAFSDSITTEKICGDNRHIIQPRVSKSIEEQKRRIVDKAEVFTPSWICNSQNNLIDKAWFQTDQDVFNREVIIDGINTWEITEHLPPFPKGKNWKKYISEKRLEMACGEAPYLCSRYDTTTGEIISIDRRIGLLDRKLQLVNANTPDITQEMGAPQRKNVHKIWRRAAYRALQSTYGFEWQGDNLLLARESLLITFIEYYQEKWHTIKLPEKECLKKVAEIISWNIWQMDGIKYGIPGYTPSEPLDKELFEITIPKKERYCRIMEWKSQEPLKGEQVIFIKMLNTSK